MSKMYKGELIESLRVGWVMGLQSFKLRAIGSRLGPLWPTVGLALRICFIGLVFGLVLDTRPVEYIPWLATGWAIWGLLSSSITNGAEALVNNKALLLTISIPKEAVIIQVVVSELLLLLQNSVVILVVLLVFQIPLSWSFLLALPGLALTACFLVGLGMSLAPLVAKFRDLGHLLASVVGVMFFMLPIMWQPDNVESDIVHLLLGLNPLYHFLQISRLPFLMQTPTLTNYLLGLLGSVGALLAGLFVLRRTNDRIMYWI